MLKIKSGIGYDIHEVINGNGLYIGGILVSDKLEFVAHSDGDVLIHAIVDSLLGAAGEGDIGEMFPDSDKRYKNIKSDYFLKEIRKIYKEKKLEIINIDCTVIAETPKLTQFKSDIRKNISNILGISPDTLNIKAKTKEKMDSVGRGEAIECYSIAMIRVT